MVMRVEGALRFIPHEVARRVAALAAKTPVIGLEAPGWGVALADGEVVTVLSLTRGAASRPAPRLRWQPGGDWPVPGAHHAILCDVGGTTVALTGGEIVATGIFEAAEGGGVMWRDAPAPPLDVAALHAQAEAAIWAARAAGRAADAPPAGGAT
ncbi:MAG: hypothetical protein IT372_20255 [Polyangiaceae bacterium]|nr:hypothetical protein [Polyangiaceae bacterium]